MKVYNDFFEFWKEKYPNQPDWVKGIAIEAWDACVQGFTLDEFSNSEIITALLERRISMSDIINVAMSGKVEGLKLK